MSQLKNLIMTLFLAIFLTTLFFSSQALIDPTLEGPNNNESQTMTYIKSSCNDTLYPELCIRCLSKFAHSTIDGPQHLAHVALSVSLSRALYTKGYLLKVANEISSINKEDNKNKNKREYLTVQDCVNQITDSVDQLSQAIKELRRMNQVGSTISDEFLWHISNVETWVSTALTDASSCVYAFPGHRMSKRTATIKVKAKNVAELTSNALALFHSYAAKYREAATRNIIKP